MEILVAGQHPSLCRCLSLRGRLRLLYSVTATPCYNGMKSQCEPIEPFLQIENMKGRPYAYIADDESRVQTHFPSEGGGLLRYTHRNDPNFRD